ncbi:MAG: sortase [Clostridiales bacterium]|nr:sortase [Clostridiales bacterium]
MRSKIGSFLMALGVLLLLAAVGLLGYNRWDNWRAGQSVADLQDALEDAEDADIVETDGLSLVFIDGYAYIGTLSIPSYGLELPVMSQWSYPGLKIAPGRYTGSPQSDNLIICGHNYERHFGNLKYLEAGDEITFTDVKGNVYTYQVEEVLILQPTDVEEMVSQDAGEWDLTLFTCTIGGRTRVTVRCSRTE